MEFLLNSYGPLGRKSFIIRTLGLLLVGSGVGYAVYEAGYHLLHFKTVGIFFAIVNCIFFGIALFIQIMRRMQDLGRPSITFFIPVYNLYLLCLILFAPGKTSSDKPN